MINPTPKNDFRKQLIGLGAFVAIVAISVLVFFGLKSLGTRPVSSGSGSIAQLAETMERAFPVVNIIGVTEDDTVVWVMMYDPDPNAEWGEKEHKQLDLLFVEALKYATSREKGLIISVLHSQPAVDLSGQEVQILYNPVSSICLDSDALQEVDWSSADHETIVKHCTIIQVGALWINAEDIMWPPE